MNGIISLCHFCELHGPSVVFCSQAFHMALSSPQFPVFPEEIISSLKKSNSSVFSPSSPPEGSSLSAHSSPLHKETSHHHSLAHAKTSPACPACAPPDDIPYLTHDYDAMTTYVGSRYPFDQQLYSIVRQACVRRSTIPFYLFNFIVSLLISFIFIFSMYIFLLNFLA